MRGGKGFEARDIRFPEALHVTPYASDRQYITTGNLEENDRAFLFLMNYAERERIKIWGRARVVASDDALFERLSHPAYDARVEQAIVFDVAAWDGNCPQHIPQLVHVSDVIPKIDALRERIVYLERTLHDAGVPFDA